MLVGATSFVIDLMRHDLNAIKKLEELNKKGISQIITTPTLFELWSGVVQAKKTEEEKNKIKDVLINQTILNLDKESAEEAGQIDGRLNKQSINIEVVDSLIAGIAKVNNKKVLTRNLKHFEKTGVKIESY